MRMDGNDEAVAREEGGATAGTRCTRTWRWRRRACSTAAGSSPSAATCTSRLFAVSLRASSPQGQRLGRPPRLIRHRELALRRMPHHGVTPPPNALPRSGSSAPLPNPSEFDGAATLRHRNSPSTAGAHPTPGKRR